MAEQGGRSADGAGGVDEGEPTGVIGPKTKDHHTAHHGTRHSPAFEREARMKRKKIFK